MSGRDFSTGYLSIEFVVAKSQSQKLLKTRNWRSYIYFLQVSTRQKLSPSGVLIKGCSENTQKNYKRKITITISKITHSKMCLKLSRFAKLFKSGFGKVVAVNLLHTSRRFFIKTPLGLQLYEICKDTFFYRAPPVGAFIFTSSGHTLVT